jgi:hypothetical protein
MHISLAPRSAAALALPAVSETACVVWIAAKPSALFGPVLFGPALFGERSPMSLYARLDALKERHALLESRIFDEDHRPQPDTETLARLKIEKLQIKDEMERIRTSLH